MEFCDLNAQQTQIYSQVRDAIERVLKHGKYILGPEVDALEEALTQYTASRYCVTCANGTDALQIALMALGINRGDEVIVPAFSYIATAEAVLSVGATPIFCDIETETYNLNPKLIEQHITPHTRAIIAASLFGQCADFSQINPIAEKYKLPVIEDAAQSFGATLHGIKSCNLSTIATTSFFPAKPLGCYGDGGAVFTNDENLAKQIRMIARHGQSKRYYHEVPGVNSRLDTIQAAILLEKLKIFPDEIIRRESIAKKYTALLVGSKVILPNVRSGFSSTWAQYTVKTTERESLQRILQQDGIPTAVHYPYPLHRQPVFSSSDSLPYAEQASDQVISLPMHPYLTDTNIEKIAKSIQQF